MQPKILVVDDDAGSLAWMSRCLREEHFDVLISQRPDDALDQARRNHPDGALLDLYMPGMDGYRLHLAMTAIPGLESLIPVFISGDDRGARIVESVSHGRLRVLLKHNPLSNAPLTRQEMAEALRTAVRNRRICELGKTTPVADHPADMLYVCLSDHSVSFSGEYRHIPEKPYALLYALISRPRFSSYDFLWERAWTGDLDMNILRVTISNLKTVLGNGGSGLILSVSGGYRLTVEPIPAPGGVYLPAPGLSAGF